MSREEIQEEYHIFSLAGEYYVDPEELTDAIAGRKLPGLERRQFYGKFDFDGQLEISNKLVILLKNVSACGIIYIKYISIDAEKEER